MNHPERNNDRATEPTVAPPSVKRAASRSDSLWGWIREFRNWSPIQQLAVACLACIAIDFLVVASCRPAGDALGLVVCGLALAAVLMRLAQRFKAG